MTDIAHAGEVILLGAGPGDPELLTIKGMKALQQADIVVYDSLANPALLQHMRPEAKTLYVGKRKGHHSMTQTEINQLLIRLAQQGLKVVRLKGGDPMIFGRAGEEMRQLADAGVRCQVIPGISAALGAAANTLMPLTHRDYASAVTFISAHRQDGSVRLELALLVDARQTLVFYMGLSALHSILGSLIEAGRPLNTPIAVVANACLPKQQCIQGTLSTIIDQVAEAKVPSPALIIVGECVHYAQELAADYAALAQTSAANRYQVA